MFLVSENGARPRLDSRAEEAESQRQKESGGLIHGHMVPVVQVEKKYTYQEGSANMKIQKQTLKNRDYSTHPMFARKMKYSLALSSAVRDFILPHRYIDVELVSDGIVIKPTDDTNKYKLTISKGGQASFSWTYADRFLQLPYKAKYDITKLDDGCLLIVVNHAPKKVGLDERKI